MDEREFWRLMEAARERIGPFDEHSERECGRPSKEHGLVLISLLPAEPQAFQQHFDQALTALYTFDGLGGLHLLEALGEEQELVPVCNWLVLQGQGVVDAFASDPDVIVDLELEWGLADGLDEVAATLYHQLFASNWRQLFRGGDRNTDRPNAGKLDRAVAEVPG